MNDIRGTVIASTIVPSSSGDTYPTHDEVYGKGGYRTVGLKTDLKSISSERTKPGMVVYVESGTTDEVGEYRLISGSTPQNQKWEKTDKYDINDIPIDISLYDGFSAITKAAEALNYYDNNKKEAKIDTWKKAIDVLMYLFTINSGEAPAEYTFDVVYNGQTMVLPDSANTLSFAVTSITSNFAPQNYEVSIDNSDTNIIESSLTKNVNACVIDLSASTNGTFDVIFKQNGSNFTKAFNFTIHMPINDCGYYIMLAENLNPIPEEYALNFVDEGGNTICENLTNLSAICNSGGDGLRYFAENSSFSSITSGTYENNDYTIYAVSASSSNADYSVLTIALDEELVAKIKNPTYGKNIWGVSTDPSLVYDYPDADWENYSLVGGGTLNEGDKISSIPTEFLSESVAYNFPDGLKNATLFYKSMAGTSGIYYLKIPNK